MFAELIAPEGLKGTAATIQAIELWKIRMFTAQFTPLDPVCRHAGIVGFGWLFPHGRTFESKNGCRLVVE